MEKMKLWKNKFRKVPEIQVFRLKRLTKWGRSQEKRSKPDHILVKFLHLRHKEEILTSFQAETWYLNEKIIKPSSDSDLHFLTLYIVKQHTWTFERKDHKARFPFWAKVSLYMKATTDFFQTYNGPESKQPYVLSKETAWEVRQPNES